MLLVVLLISCKPSETSETKKTMDDPIIKSIDNLIANSEKN